MLPNPRLLEEVGDLSSQVYMKNSYLQMKIAINVKGLPSKNYSNLELSNQSHRRPYRRHQQVRRL
jgi:hypothetical protein